MLQPGGGKHFFRMILVLMFLVVSAMTAVEPAATASARLRFRSDGTFKILQVPDMHYADGKATPCKDVYASQMHSCSDLNTTIFVKRLLDEEKPDFVVFTGDNIDGDATDAIASMNAAFAPVIKQKIPWAAVLGNHDQESNLPRDKVMQHIAEMDFSLSRVHPENSPVQPYGFGNFHHSVFGLQGTTVENQSLLNLYFFDSGDYSKVQSVAGYDWIRANQQVWFQNLSSTLKKSRSDLVPALAFFHIPLPEYDTVLHSCSSIHGQHQERVCSASLNSGFFSTLVEAGDVKAAFVGHDHVNDYCGHLLGVQLCYGGVAGYHAYGKAGWARRTRLIITSLTTQKQQVRSISTWKRLDDMQMSMKDSQILWDAFNDVTARTCSLFTVLFNFYGTQPGFMVFVGGLITLLAMLIITVVVLFMKLNKLKARYIFISGSKS